MVLQRITSFQLIPFHKNQFYSRLVHLIQYSINYLFWLKIIVCIHAYHLFIKHAKMILKNVMIQYVCIQLRTGTFYKVRLIILVFTWWQLLTYFYQVGRTEGLIRFCFLLIADLDISKTSNWWELDLKLKAFIRYILLPRPQGTEIGKY